MKNKDFLIVILFIGTILYLTVLQEATINYVSKCEFDYCICSNGLPYPNDLWGVRAKKTFLMNFYVNGKISNEN